jgi:hypothetical protein
MIFLAIIGIALISIGFALLSLQSLQKGLKTQEAQEELKKGRVIFHSSDVSSSTS